MLCRHLCTCSKSLRATDDLLFKFLWDGKGDEIKQTKMIADLLQSKDVRHNGI